MRQLSLLFLAIVWLTPITIGQTIIDFEDLGLPAESHRDGVSSTLGTFQNDLQVGQLTFHNSYSRADWGSGIFEYFSGFAYSRVTDNSTPGYENQYSCIAGQGAGNSQVYGVYYSLFPLRIELSESQTAGSMKVCNATYTYFSMRDGDAFTKKFGGPSGEDPDYFFIRISGWKEGMITDSLDVYLADYRFDDSSQDYLIGEWLEVDLSPLGAIDALEFSLFSSDNGDWGMNTPAYFCVDDILGNSLEDLSFISGDYWNGSTAALGTHPGSFESGPASLPNEYSLSDWGWGMSGFFTGWAVSSESDVETRGFSNQFSAIAGSGASGSSTYALCYNSRGSDTLFLTQPFSGISLDITNGTYPYYSMLEGDAFAKKFGGQEGTDPDFFKVIITGLLNGQTTGIVDFYLADFRSENPADDYILDHWESVDLSGLGNFNALVFSLSSSDNGDWGMNTPAYFFIDNLIIDHTSGILSDYADSQILVFPNPVNETLTINSSSPITGWELYSITGQLVFQEEIQATPSLTRDLSDLKPGHYLLRIRTQSQTETQTFIKTN